MSAANSKSYFDDALTKAEYYMDDQELRGILHGKLAARLGLSTDVTKDAFYALCDNLRPDSGGSITPKTKEERTVSYDINFHAPKSVSIVEFLSNDSRILNAFNECVQKTMTEIETDARVRVRKGKADFDKRSGELVWSTFVHKTSRPTPNQNPDPHLHAHCVTFNMSYDVEEQTFKAGQFREIKRGMPYYQALFHKHLSDRLMDMGYQVRRTRTAFEIEGVPQKVIDHFSKRTDEIGRVAKENNIVNPKELDALGAKTRKGKKKDLKMSELKASWRKQITDNGYENINPDAIVRKDRQRLGRFMTPEQSLQHGLDHSFSRASVVPTKRVMQEALRHSIGTPEVSPDDLKKQFASDTRIVELEEGTQLMCTTREVLKEERDMVQFAKQGMATMAPLYKKVPSLALEGQQAEAAKHILTTSDRVSIIQGAAGAGKTTLMTEAVRMVERAGKHVSVLAPSTEAADVLRKQGFDDAATVALFLVDKRLHPQIANGVLWVDEAGQLSTPDAKRLLEITRDQNARLILGGDPKQHSSVVRGDALRILKKYGGIKPAEVNKIFRQQTQVYREAVQDLNDGKIAAGFAKLESIGSICQIDQKEPNKELVADYVAAVKAGKSTLVICPTHEHGAKVTADIRQALKEAKLIGMDEHAVRRYDSLKFTDAQKTDIQNYQEGQWIRFSQNCKGVKRGSMWQVEKNWGGGVILKDEDGKTASLPLDQPTRFDVMQKGNIDLAKGDRIRVTQNSYDATDKRLHNGTMLEVTGIDKSGAIKLRNAASRCKYTLKPDFGHIAHAHCVTSHAAQGKTVDEVFIAQPSSTFDATNAKQFYVSASRGKTFAKFYTDDKEELLKHVSKEGNRQSAIEFVSGHSPTHKDYVKIHQRAEYERSDNAPDRSEKRKAITKDRDYEP